MTNSQAQSFDVTFIFEQWTLVLQTTHCLVMVIMYNNSFWNPILHAEVQDQTQNPDELETLWVQSLELTLTFKQESEHTHVQAPTDIKAVG
jgi:hypothetical protein